MVYSLYRLSLLALLLLAFQIFPGKALAGITVQDQKSLILRDGGRITGTVQVFSGSRFVPEFGAGCVSLESLTLDSGSTLAIELGGTTACSQYDRLAITGGIGVSGAILDLAAPDVFVPSDADTFLIIDNDASDAVAGTFLGLPEGASIGFAGKNLTISYVGGDGNDVTLTTGVLPKESQTITFNALDNKAYGDSFPVSATATSGLDVIFSSQTPLVCSVSGATASLVGLGTCTIRASQNGNVQYNAAPDIDRSFTVADKLLTVTGLSAENKTYDGNTSATVTGTAMLSGVVGSDAVSLTGIPVGTFSDAAVGNNKPVTITGMSITGADSSHYTMAAPTVTASILKVDQSISFPALADKVLGEPNFTVSATASSALTVSFVGSTPGVCQVSGSTVSLVAPGTCTISASQAGNTTFNAATSVVRSFQVRAMVLLNVVVNGTGMVTSDIGEINCPGTCSDIYYSEDTVTLMAVPGERMAFIGWSGDSECGTDGVVVVGSNDIECTATFRARYPWALFLPAIMYNSTHQAAP